MRDGADIRDNIVLKTLHEELVGPCAYGEEIDVINPPTISAELNTVFVTKTDREEILKVFPTQRYGVGVIYPQDMELESNSSKELPAVIPEDLDESENEFDGIQNNKQINSIRQSSDDDSNDFDIALTNSKAPSSIGLSFLLDPKLTDEIVFEISGAFYKNFKINIQRTSQIQETWWYRKPIKINFKKKISELNKNFKFKIANESNNPEDLLNSFYIEGVKREHKGKLLITVAVVNRHTLNASFIEKNQKCMFQTQLRVIVPNIDSPAILPYPELENDYLSEDELSNRLLYRNAPVFAKGHGVASNWNSTPYSETKAVTSVFTESLPSFETPSISAEVEIDNNNSLVISMEALANFEIGGEGEQQIKALISAYSNWISQKLENINALGLDSKLQKTAETHIRNCQEALVRIEAGYSLIKTNLKVRRAFQLANKAMLNQQKHAPKSIREIGFDQNGHPYVKTPFKENTGAKGIWRPFQIGFLLMCIQGAIDNTHVDHEKVDLIWFPTGGGKTEAYLGLAAFTLIYNRLENGNEADGVHVLMRYTLRLLTAQQLQRAATLICCLEAIRQEEKIPGKRFSIGLWVGGENTPNKRSQAITKLNELKSNLKKKKETNNPFLIDRCPYCGTQMGIVNINDNSKVVVGYNESKESNSVIFSCVDTNCLFHKQIPVFVIDEDIYDERPSVVIGTVDKFAMLAWQPKIRSIFGLDDNGKRCALPPQLIIQDELHLISGPLGSMVALYEPLIEKLCSEDLNGIIRKPKIICATATTKGYREQIDGIYGRKDVSIFPPPGLDAEDSFFAKYSRDSEGKLLPGRKYVGVCAPGLGSILTTQVRTQSALLFAANRVEIEQRDPWVTLLSFYNSIRELGGAITLFQSDIVGYLLEQKRRYPRWVLPRRIYPDQGMELTSRLKDDEIPKAIVALEKKLNLSDLSDIYKNLGGELKDLERKYPELSKYTSQLTQRIERENKIWLEDYYCLENIKMYLTRQNTQLKLPKNCKKLYEICINYNVRAFCLASSIIEVGVDIDRLSLMSIIGQPKTTAQYIQVSGRVGRKADERPGLVVTIYNNSKPRDKSHYEDFRGYHQRLYAKVEPSSVTPFSRPAIKRGLGAITIANVRQTSPIDAKPSDIDKSLIVKWVDELFKLRAHSMTQDEQTHLASFFDHFLKRWDKIKTTYNEWGQLKRDSEPAQQDLLLPLGTARSAKAKICCPTSMRNVDKESSLWITGVYDQFEEEDDWDE
ncbi:MULTISPECIES: helicase-related protein [Acinetobacter]|uniref:helicase-related protein n=2 Tax=Moraxellaceae TaxID=468 RepID=UPI0002CF53DD|nr:MULTISPECIES: helicase-related protein [Acinetobacter]ENX33404.1 hypothetical protein F890_00087 [Acinetobacter sp. CIP 64.7]